MRRTIAWLGLLAACGGGGGAAVDVGPSDAGADAAPALDAGGDAGEDGGDAGCTPPPKQASCDPIAGGCPAIAVAGDPFAADSGTFQGYADPTLAVDEAAADRIWLAYSWPHVEPGTDPDGGAILLAAVSSHLAKSEDRGATFAYVKELYPSRAVADPEGSGQNGLSSSETVSLASMGGIFYAAHLRYFLQAKNGYNPKFATSYTVHVGAASSPDALSEANEAVLGVSTTAAVYAPNARLDQLAGLPVQRCAILNNPTLFAKDGTLYVAVECLAFVGPTADFANSTMQVFATKPSGDPSTWTWRWAGLLFDHSLAVELGADTIQQPDVSLAADGTIVAIVSRAHVDPAAQYGTAVDGCVAVELASIDPPVVRRDCKGNAVIRARVDGADLGACTHDAASLTGIVATAHHPGSPFRLVASGVRP